MLAPSHFDHSVYAARLIARSFRHSHSGRTAMSDAPAICGPALVLISSGKLVLATMAEARDFSKFCRHRSVGAAKSVLFVSLPDREVMISYVGVSAAFFPIGKN
jgi:hypothetical protein